LTSVCCWATPAPPADDLRQARELAMLICQSEEAIKTFIAHCDVAARSALPLWRCRDCVVGCVADQAHTGLGRDRQAFRRDKRNTLQDCGERRPLKVCGLSRGSATDGLPRGRSLSFRRLTGRPSPIQPDIADVRSPHPNNHPTPCRFKAARPPTLLSQAHVCRCFPGLYSLGLIRD
jgi:hypothetical protein